MQLIRKSRAFSIIELLAVLAVIGVMMALLAPRIMKLFTGGKVSATEQQLQSIQSTIMTYALRTGKYPRSLSELTRKAAKTTNYTGPFLDEDKEMNDAWGNPIQYNYPPRRFKNQFKKYELYSFGADEEESEDDPRLGE